MKPERLRERGKWLRQLTFFAAESIADDFDEAADDMERLMLRMAELEADSRRYRKWKECGTPFVECVLGLDGDDEYTANDNETYHYSVDEAIDALVVWVEADVPLAPELPVVEGEVVT